LVVRKDGSDFEIEQILGLPAGLLAGAFSSGGASAFVLMRAHLVGRSCLMSVSSALNGTAPQWIEILPLGDFNTNAQDGRGPFHADGAKVIAATKANGLDRGLPIDYDHRTFTGDDSRAAGWIRELKIQGGALMARVEWTPAGASAIEKKEYRFISPVFKCQPDDPDAPKDEISGEVLFLRGAALTNDPALTQLTELSRLAA
jgi:phage I-like protein